jgi:hypothetical protein
LNEHFKLFFQAISGIFESPDVFDFFFNANLAAADKKAPYF